MCATTLFMCLITVVLSCKMRLDILERVDTVMRETGVNGLVRTDQPNDDSAPLMSAYRTVPRIRPRRTHGLTDENIDSMAQAVHQRIQSRGIKFKSPLPPLTITTQ